jgi:hypothetical protein
MFKVPRSTVYGHLDKTRTVPRESQQTAVAKSRPLLCGWCLREDCGAS